MIDGPYIYDTDENQFPVWQIKKQHDEIIADNFFIDKGTAASLRCFVDDVHGDYFDFELRNTAFTAPPSTYDNADRIFAVADIEGNFYAFERLLIGNGVMDKNYNWSFGKGHLVLNGDFVDRGKNVIPLLWLMYKLEYQATQVGGQVHYILGNHEDFFAAGNIKYVHHKYFKSAKKLTGIDEIREGFKALNNKNLFLRKWMLSKNSIEKIGNILFVHGGISKKLLATGVSMDEVNLLIRKVMQKKPLNEREFQLSDLLFHMYGPLWYRGFVFNYRNDKKDTEEHIQNVLDYFDAKQIIIGHNMVDEISPDYNQKLYRIDVRQSNDKVTGEVSGLLIENGRFYRVDDKGVGVLI